jgi:hypothetical protein
MSFNFNRALVSESHQQQATLVQAIVADYYLPSTCSLLSLTTVTCSLLSPTIIMGSLLLPTIIYLLDIVADYDTVHSLAIVDCR